MNNKIDFDRALTLLKIIVEAGRHGPAFQRLASEAGNELKAMVGEYVDEKPKVVTPPAGPENSAIEHRDGTMTPLPQNPNANPNPNTNPNYNRNLNPNEAQHQPHRPVNAPAVPTPPYNDRRS